MMLYLNDLVLPDSLRFALLASDSALLRAARSGLALAMFSLCFNFLMAAFSEEVNWGLDLSMAIFVEVA